MSVFHPEFAALNVPRYTSYPTAASFSQSVGAADQLRALAALPAGVSASLYVHIPFCERICWYCGCNTGAAGRPDRLARYVEALTREIRLVAGLTKARITRVHFGGGSPNALPPIAFAGLCEVLRDSFRIDRDAEWAVELDPRSLDADYAATLAGCGINRASLGAQTFSMKIQARINRIQPFRDVALRAAELRSAGIAAINLDLMYGLPGQTLDDIASTVARARLIAPARIAMFGYAHMPQMLSRQRMIDGATLPDARARFAQSMLASDLLKQQGFVTIGFDHYARPEDSFAEAAAAGSLRRNFQGFTDDDSDVLIGLGVSAISQFGDVIVQNEKHLGRYEEAIAGARLAGSKGVSLRPADRARGWVIERLLCDSFVDLQKAQERFGISGLLDRTAHDRLAGLVLRGIATISGAKLAVTPEGLPYARLVASAFDEHLVLDAQRFSRTV
jgi:oxygen-independent coproporphyrinogen-3 oxidase